MIRTALACALLLAPTALHAQQQRFSTYATVDVTDWGVQENGNSDFKGDAAGFTAGAFYTFPVNSRFKPALDAKLIEAPGRKGGTAGLVALRVYFVPHRNRLRPFLQVGGGAVSIPVGDGTLTSRHSSGALELDFGLDIRLTSNFDLRLPEYGAAGGNYGVGFLGTGLVFHFD
jgi:hypothetical protein